MSQIVLHRHGQHRRRNVPHDADVIGEQIFASHGKLAQGGPVLIGEFRVGIRQHSLQLHRLLSPEQVLQLSKLPPWQPIHQQDLQLFITHRDSSNLAVVRSIQLVGQFGHLQHHHQLTHLAGGETQLKLLRPTILGDTSLPGRQDLTRVLVLECCNHRSPCTALSSQAERERQGLTQERGVVSQHPVDFQIEQRVGAPEDHGEDRDRVLAGETGRSRQGLAIGCDAICQHDDGGWSRTAQGIQAVPQTLSQATFTPHGNQFAKRNGQFLNVFAGHHRVRADHGVGLGDGIHPQLVILRQIMQQPGIVCQQQTLRLRQASGGAQPVFLGQPTCQFGLIRPGVPIERSHARRCVDHHEQVGKPRSFDRQQRLA